MGACAYCGKGAGLFRRFHEECEAAFNEATSKMQNLVSGAASAGGDLSGLRIQLAQVAESGRVGPSDFARLLASGWSSALDAALESNGLSAEEESALSAFAGQFDLTQDQLDSRDRGWTRFIEASVLRRVLEGYFPSDIKVNIEGQMPFNLQKGERLVWLFPGAEYFRETTKTVYEGGSSGYSVRVARGVYLRQSSFRGRPIRTSSLTLIDAGVAGVTTKQIYFAGRTKAFRVPYRKIVSYEFFDDGLAFHRDTAAAKREVIKTGDGWFAYNLVSNLASEPELRDIPQDTVAPEPLIGA